jgi:hypothetical protein
MQIIVISEKHKKYTNGVVSNQLMEVGRDWCVCWGGSESAEGVLREYSVKSTV